MINCEKLPSQRLHKQCKKNCKYLVFTKVGLFKNCLQQKVITKSYVITYFLFLWFKLNY